MFKINDFVRFIPPTYLDIFRHFNYVENWSDADPINDECAMLGGKYKILDVTREDSGNTFYSLIPNGVNNRGWIYQGFLVSDNELKNCPYAPGDNVVLSIGDEDIRKQYFPLDSGAYAFHDKNHVYKITSIINNFYIFLDYGKENPYSAPFRWDNFKKF